MVNSPIQIKRVTNSIDESSRKSVGSSNAGSMRIGGLARRKAAKHVGQENSKFVESKLKKYQKSPKSPKIKLSSDKNDVSDQINIVI